MLAEEAKLEVERADSALRYRKSQMAEAEAELLSLEGIGGIFAALMGRKAAYQEELIGKITALKSEILKERKRLIEARQNLAKFDKAKSEQDQKKAERDAHLDAFAQRVRSSASHPLKRTLLGLEDEMQAELDTLTGFEEALAATMGLLGAMGKVMALTMTSKRYQSVDTYTPLPFMSELAFLKRVEVRSEAQALPAAIARFNDASESVGLKALDIRVPDIGMGWDQLFIDGFLMDSYRLAKIEQFARRLDDERDMVRETMLWLSNRRKESSDRIQVLLSQRRDMLDEALG